VPLEGIVLDFDGVIADTEPLHLRAFQAVLSAIGIGLTDRDYYARYLGYDDETVFRMMAEAVGRSLSPAKVAGLVAEKALVYERAIRAQDVLYGGAADAIRRLAAVAPLAIASGALRPEIELVLDRVGLLPSFRAIVAAGEAAAGKPAPDQYLRAADLLGVPAASCVAVEDSPHGVRAALAAGMRTVAVTTSCPPPALEGAAVIVPGLAAISADLLSRVFRT